MRSLSLLAVFGVVALAQRGGNRFHSIDEFGEWDAGDDDYDYKIIEVTKFAAAPGRSINQFASQFYRSYNRGADQHYYHSNKHNVFSRRARGYSAEDSIGRIVSMQTYQRQRAGLQQSCPQLSELYYMGKNGAQFLTPNFVDTANLRSKGWKQFSSVGYCVKSVKPACGATEPLLELRRIRQSDDYLYTSSRIEFARINNAPNGYINTPRDVICWLWK